MAASLVMLAVGGVFAQAPANDNAQSPYQVVSGTPSSAADQNRLRQAIADFKAGKLAEAAAGLESLEKKSPNDVTAHSLLGYIYLKQNKNDQAIAEMETVVKLAPGDISGRKNLGRAYLQVGRDNEAIAQFKAVLSRSPKDTDALYGQALAQAQTGSLADAADGFRQVIALKPTSAAYQNLGVVLQKSGKNAEAADAFRQASTLDPKNAVAWLNAGLLYAQTGAGAKAIPALTQALALGTDYKYEAHMALAQVYVAQKNNPKALSEFAAAASVRPNDPTALFDLAVIQTQARQTPAAEQTYRKLLAANPAGTQILTQARTNLGLLLAADGKGDEAIPLLQAAAQADPKNAAPHLALANLYAKAGDAAKAISERQVAVAINPQDIQTRLLLADALLADKKYAEAAMQYEAVTKRDSGNAAVQNALGTAYEQMNDLARAQAAFKSALIGKGSAREKAQAQNNLGVVYEKQGKQAQAIAAYKKAIALDPTLTEAKTNLARFRK